MTTSIWIRMALAIAVAGMATADVSAQRQMENLGRGIIATNQGDGQVFVSWRLLGIDPEDIAFNLYRKTGDAEPAKLNDGPISEVTWFRDQEADLTEPTEYFVRPVLDGVEREPSRPFAFPANAPAVPYLSIPLQTPEGYRPNDGSAADLTGDGEYEIIIKQEGRARDNAHAGETDPVILQAYKLDGTLLWEINLGINIRAGAHYTQFMVYDLDGNGRAEIVCKTADGTVDGVGNVIGDPDVDHRNEAGYILRGPEYLTVFDGRTGAALETVDYIPPRHPDTTEPTSEQINALWGDGYGNRVDRFLAGVAYLDGERPSVIFARGYYTRAVLAAWDWRDGELKSRWVFDSHDGTPGNRAYAGQGNHSLSIADLTGDGRDEIIFGACVIGPDGQGLHSTGWGHGDALHVTRMDPDDPRQMIFMPHESPRSFGPNGMSLRDGVTGELIAGVAATRDVGRGVAFDIDPRYPGFEFWGSADTGGMYNVRMIEPNEELGPRAVEISSTKPRSINFAVWWQGDELRELLDGTRIMKWDWEKEELVTLLDAAEYDCVSINGTKANPVLSADLFGDWREEVIWPTEDGSELRIFTTTEPTQRRLFTLMHDPQYRLAIAWQNVAYNQPPHPSFYFGHGMQDPPRPQIHIAEGDAAE
jgi:rhamnogalacturonan endolyase